MSGDFWQHIGRIDAGAAASLSAYVILQAGFAVYFLLAPVQGAVDPKPDV